MTVASDPSVRAIRLIALIALLGLFVFVPAHDWELSRGTAATGHAVHTETHDEVGHGAAACALAMLALTLIGVAAMGRARERGEHHLPARPEPSRLNTASASGSAPSSLFRPILA